MDEQLQYIKQYNLHYIMQYLGYTLDKTKSTKTSKKYKDNRGNIFIVKGNTYFNTFDNTDNGTTIDFIQNNIINKKNFYEVKKWFYKNIDSNIKYNTNGNNIEKINNRQTKGMETSFLVLYQKIYKNKIVNIKSIRNIDIDIFNMLIDKEIIKYYYKYKLIKIPLYNGNTFDNINITGILNINIENYTKFLEKGSNKGIFLFGNKINPKYTILLESFLDSLSYLQLLSIKYNKSYTDIIANCLFISTNGSISINNIQTIKNIFNDITNNNTIILSFDNDNIGRKYDNDIIPIIPNNKEYYINKSITKDYNEDLQMYYKEQYNKQYLNNIINIFFKQ